MSRRGHALVLLALALPIATAACSSGSDSSATSSVADTIAPTTEPTTTEASTTTSTTEAPTTTIDPADAFAAEVEADLLETLRLTDEAFQDPTDEAKVAAALDGHIDGNLSYIEGQLDNYRSNGWAARPNADVPATTTIEVSARRDADHADQAIVQVCEVSSWFTVEVGAGPNGSDLVIDPDITSFRSNYVLQLTDGRWMIVGSELLNEFSGSSECPTS